MPRSRSFVFAAVVVALAGVAAATATQRAHSARPEARSVKASQYELDDALPAMVQFRGNADIVVAHVVSVDAARWSTRDGRAPASSVPSVTEYVYTPVHVMIDDVVRGGSVRAGQTIVVRRYGGEVGGTRFAMEGDATALLTLSRPAVLFLQPPHALLDGTTQRIANAVYSVAADGALFNVSHERRGSLASLRSLVG